MPVRTARLAGNLCNHSGIYHPSHVVIRPIICITFKYNPFSYRNTSNPFSYRKDQYLGPVQTVWPVRCFVTPIELEATGVELDE